MKHPLTLKVLLASTSLLAAVHANAAASNPGERTMPIDDTLFVASGSDVQTISVERWMNASPEEVWEAWTSESGWKAAYGPDRPELNANIELAVGGKYEWLFDGTTGSNDCQVLSYLPPRMLSFSWNAPVAQAESREKRTWMVIEIEPAQDGGSLVRATQLGFGEEPHWVETRNYFQQGWTHVLDQMARTFAAQ
jgi:uncharacterized protein YndB with AHSA1/START domain